MPIQGPLQPTQGIAYITRINFRVGMVHTALRELVIPASMPTTAQVPWAAYRGDSALSARAVIEPLVPVVGDHEQRSCYVLLCYCCG